MLLDHLCTMPWCTKPFRHQIVFRTFDGRKYRTRVLQVPKHEKNVSFVDEKIVTRNACATIYVPVFYRWTYGIVGFPVSMCVSYVGNDTHTRIKHIGLRCTVAIPISF